MKKNLVLGLGFGLGGVIATLSIIQMGLMAHNMKINNNQKKIKPMDDEIRVYKVIPTLLNDDAKKYLEGDINQIIFRKSSLINKDENLISYSFTPDYTYYCGNPGIFWKGTCQGKPQINRNWVNFLPKLNNEWKYSLPKTLVKKYPEYFQYLDKYNNGPRDVSNSGNIFEIIDKGTNKTYWLQAFISYEKDYDNKNFVMKKYNYTTDEKPKNATLVPKYETYIETSLDFKKKKGYLIIKNNHPTKPLNIKVGFDFFGYGENY